MPHRRRLGAALSHLAAGAEPQQEAAGPPSATAAAQLPYVDDPSPAGIVAALQSTGCALLRGVVPPADAARLAQLLAGYVSTTQAIVTLPRIAP